MILCPDVTVPVNGTLVISTPSPTTQPLGVGTIVTYSCDPGYVLVGDLTRTCEDSGTGTIGTWSGSDFIGSGIIESMEQAPFCK